MHIPVTLLLGKLGSGKTTLLNRLMQSPQWAGTLVVWQQSGATELEHALAAHAPADPGVAACACCVRAQDLASTLVNATWRFSRDGHRSFQRVVIEAAGDANAAELAEVVARNPRLSGTYCMTETLFALDAATAIAQLSETFFRSSIRDADNVILTGMARVDLARRVALQRAVRELNPAARLWETMHPDVEPTALADPGQDDARHARRGLAALPCRQQCKETEHA